jgi:hypothetical protein
VFREGEERGCTIEVKRPQDEAKLATLQTAVQRGRPFGSTIWQEITAKKLGLESTFQPRGRPKKYNQLDLSPVLPPLRPRGRPRKVPADDK